MSENTNIENYQEEVEGISFAIDFRKLLADIIHYWWIFVALIVIAIAVVRIYHYYETPIFLSSMSLIVDAQGEGASRSSQSGLLEGFSLSAGARSMENQVAILNSRSLIEEVVDELGIYIRYINHGRVRDVEMYPFNGFQAVMDSSHTQLVGVPIYVEGIDDDTYLLKVDVEEASLFNYDEREYCGKVEDLKFKKKLHYGEPLITDWCAFAINGNIGSGEYIIQFETPATLTGRFRGSYSVLYNRESSSSIITLSCTGPVSSLNSDFLDHIAHKFIERNLSEKNEIAENTIAFIDTQLNILSDTLSDIGSQLSKFRLANDIQQDVKTKGSNLFSEMQNYERELEGYDVVKQYYSYLENYFQSDSIFTGVIAPAVLDARSPLITQQLNELISTGINRQTNEDMYGTLAPNRDVDIRLNIARNTLMQSIENNREIIDNWIAEAEEKLEIRKEDMMGIPELERVFLGIDRRYTLNSDVFTFLLRKRSEAQIQKASNTPDHKIIDNAINRGSISPTESRHRSIGVVLAIVLPLAFFVIRQLADGKIRSAEDLRKISNLTILSSILANNKDSSLVVEHYPKSIQAETFRLLRTKIEFMTSQKKSPIVMVTSSVSGEGKTFCALNIASVFGISGKKTILLGFDLRKLGLSKHIGAEKNVGLSNYIVGKSSLDDVIMHIASNFDVITGGAIPPNPSELIASDKVRELFEILRQNYDMIIVDTPPMGVVSDAMQMLQYVDALVFVVRQDYTEKDTLRFTLDTLREDGFKNVALILNDVNNINSRYISSGYGYGYGYRYGYGKKRYGYGYGYGGYGYGKYGKKYGSYYGGYYSED